MATSNIHNLIKTFRFLPILVTAFVLSGCASFGEGIGQGVANAVLQKADAEDTRVCNVWGESFYGIDHELNKRPGITKVLMTHGVGAHDPGYSTEFMEKLADQLDLTVRTRASKNIRLTNPHNPSTKLGNLRVTRFQDKNKSKEMLYYELTWSEITADQKALLAFDNSGEYTFRRAEVNNLMKKFSNDTGPDPIIYLGKSRPDILTAFAESFCWMTQGGWDSLPTEFGRNICSLMWEKERAAQHVKNDEFVFVSHSLGSRITIDGLQFIASTLGNEVKNVQEDVLPVNADHDMLQKEAEKLGAVPADVVAAFKDKQITIYMLSNQLPMLQLGRELPEVSSQQQNYCTQGAPYYDERMVKRTNLIAFSDPNDLLSYAIPPGFSETYLDSRLCIRVTNVDINVANIIDAFGIGKVANPMEAHVGYDSDERVVSLIAKGIGHPSAAPIVAERCDLVELID